jgi:metal-sulfur cluster biosynthetic enzyme
VITAEQVTAALQSVRDPELDDSVVELGFVEAVEINGCTVAVRLRLPTYFCAPNFAYLMCADARMAVAALPGVRAVWIILDDHHASDDINAGIAARQGFRGTFPGLADGELDELRATFRRKAFLARQDLLARALLASGHTPSDLGRLRLGDVGDGPAAAIYRTRRAELGYGLDADAPLLLDAWGAPVPPDDVPALLTRGRTTRVSIEGNAAFCRGLLQTRYATAEGATR